MIKTLLQECLMKDLSLAILIVPVPLLQASLILISCRPSWKNCCRNQLDKKKLENNSGEFLLRTGQLNHNSDGAGQLDPDGVPQPRWSRGGGWRTGDVPLPRGHRRVPEDLRVRLHLPTVPGQVRTDPTTKYGTFFSFKQTSTGMYTCTSCTGTVCGYSL